MQRGQGSEASQTIRRILRRIGEEWPRCSAEGAG